MIDYIGIAKCFEMKARADQARWRRNEDEYYRDFGRSPGEIAVQIRDRLRALHRLFRAGATSGGDASRRCGKPCPGCCDEAAPACS
jgi:hypothetical protein